MASGVQQDVAQAAAAVLNFGGQFGQLAHHQRGAGEGADDLGLALLDAAGEFDLAIAGEQRHRPHLAQIHAHGVVGLIAGFGAQFEVGELLGFLRFFGEVGLRLLEQIDARGVETGQQVVEFRARAEIVGKKIGDVVVKDVAPLLAHFNESLKTAVTIVGSHDSTPSSEKSTPSTKRNTPEPVRLRI